MNNTSLPIKIDVNELKNWLIKYPNVLMDLVTSGKETRIIFYNVNDNFDFPGKGELEPLYYLVTHED